MDCNPGYLVLAFLFGCLATVLAGAVWDAVKRSIINDHERRRQ